MNTVDALKAELLKLMRVPSEGSWGPQPIICRWCGCWLEYADNSNGKPDEYHLESCFAAKWLGRPSVP